MVSTKKRLGAKIIFNLVNSIIQIKIMEEATYSQLSLAKKR